MIRWKKQGSLYSIGEAAKEAAIDRGHDPAPLRADSDTSLVCVCHSCGGIMGIDCTERPYVFGLQGRCRA